MADFQWPGWVAPQLWPNDPRGHVFLGRAFNMIGRAIWPDWTGSEVRDAEKKVGKRIPSAKEAWTNGFPNPGIQRAFGPEVLALAGKWGTDPTLPIPVELWRAMADHSRDEHYLVTLARTRRDAAMCECHRLALSGDLRLAWRRKGGGQPLHPVEPEEWDIDYPFVPFATLGYGADFGLTSPDPTAWLFVTADSLNHVLGLGDGEPIAPVVAVNETITEPVIEPASSLDRWQSVAAELDRIGLAKRRVTAADVSSLWKNEWGAVPPVGTVTSLMSGGKKGRPSAANDEGKRQ